MMHGVSVAISNIVMTWISFMYTEFRDMGLGCWFRTGQENGARRVIIDCTEISAVKSWKPSHRGLPPVQISPPTLRKLYGIYENSHRNSLFYVLKLPQKYCEVETYSVQMRGSSNNIQWRRRQRGRDLVLLKTGRSVDPQFSLMAGKRYFPCWCGTGR